MIPNTPYLKLWTALTAWPNERKRPLTPTHAGERAPPEDLYIGAMWTVVRCIVSLCAIAFPTHPFTVREALRRPGKSSAHGADPESWQSRRTHCATRLLRPAAPSGVDDTPAQIAQLIKKCEKDMQRASTAVDKEEKNVEQIQDALTAAQRDLVDARAAYRQLQTDLIGLRRRADQADKTARKADASRVAANAAAAARRAENRRNVRPSGEWVNTGWWVSRWAGRCGLSV